jgi:hypothetical protein
MPWPGKVYVASDPSCIGCHFSTNIVRGAYIAHQKIRVLHQRNLNGREVPRSYLPLIRFREAGHTLIEVTLEPFRVVLL